MARELAREPVTGQTVTCISCHVFNMNPPVKSSLLYLHILHEQIKNIKLMFIATNYIVIPGEIVRSKDGIV